MFMNEYIFIILHPSQEKSIDIKFREAESWERDNKSYDQILDDRQIF